MPDVDLYSVVVEATPTITAGAYGAGDLVGGKIELTDAVRKATPSGTILNVTLTDLADQGADMDVVFFDSDPDTTTFTDNAAFDPTDADLVKIVGVAQLTTHVSFTDNGCSIANNVGISYRAVHDTSGLTDDTSLFAAIVTRGTPTYASISDLTLRVSILQD